MQWNNFSFEAENVVVLDLQLVLVVNSLDIQAPQSSMAIELYFITTQQIINDRMLLMSE